MTALSERLNSKAKALPLTLALTIVVGCSNSELTLRDDSPVGGIETQLQTVLDSTTDAGMPGIALSIRGDKLNFDGVSGVVDLATMEPLSSDKRFYLASVGKTYLSVLTVRLAAEGLLGLDDPISRWLPNELTGRIPSSEAITVRHLLNHTSGLFDFQNDGEEWDQALLSQPNRRWRNSDVLPFFLDQPLHFEPASDYRYSNSNYVLAALIVERATGLPIENVIRNRIIEPLSLQNTLHGNEAEGVAGFVHGYVMLDDTLTDVHPWYAGYGVSDGGIQASAADLADFAHGFVTNDLVLDDVMREELFRPSGVGNPPSDYALGLNVTQGERPNFYVFDHAGKDPGSQAQFIHVVSGESHVTVALCANASFDHFDGMFEQTLQTLLVTLSEAGDSLTQENVPDE